MQKVDEKRDEGSKGTSSNLKQKERTEALGTGMVIAAG